MAGVQVETSGATKVLPAPESVVSLVLAPATATAPRAATRARLMRASPLFMNVFSLKRGLAVVTGGACPGAIPPWANALLHPGDGVVNGPGRACGGCGRRGGAP